MNIQNIPFLKIACLSLAIHSASASADVIYFERINGPKSTVNAHKLKAANAQGASSASDQHDDKEASELQRRQQDLVSAAEAHGISEPKAKASSITISRKSEFSDKAMAEDVVSEQPQKVPSTEHEALKDTDSARQQHAEKTDGLGKDKIVGKMTDQARSLSDEQGSESSSNEDAPQDGKGDTNESMTKNAPVIEPGGNTPLLGDGEDSLDPSLDADDTDTDTDKERQAIIQETARTVIDSHPDSRKQLAKKLFHYQGMEWKDLNSGNRQHLMFDTNDYKINQDQQGLLESYLDTIPKGASLVIIGFADSHGDIYINQNTARLRSESTMLWTTYLRPDLEIRTLHSTSWPGSGDEARRVDVIEILP